MLFSDAKYPEAVYKRCKHSIHIDIVDVIGMKEQNSLFRKAGSGKILPQI